MNERATPNYYEVLQLQPYANPTLVIAAYRILSKLYHPDTARDDANLELFRQLQQAYDTLSDPQKRQEYDRELRLRTPGNPTYAGQPYSEVKPETDPTTPGWAPSPADNTWNYTPSEEDLEFYRNLYDYDNTGPRPRALVLIIIYVFLMGGGLISGVLGFITAFSVNGSRGSALLYFAVGIALVIVAQLEAYFS